MLIQLDVPAEACSTAAQSRSSILLVEDAKDGSAGVKQSTGKSYRARFPRQSLSDQLIDNRDIDDRPMILNRNARARSLSRVYSSGLRRLGLVCW